MPSNSAPRLVHNVYFTLREDTPTARERLIVSCHLLLAPIEGIELLAVGPRDEALSRDVNDREFDVALTIVFRDRAAHDRYQPDARHQQFIDENKGNWAAVRVFDAAAEGR